MQRCFAMLHFTDLAAILLTTFLCLQQCESTISKSHNSSHDQSAAQCQAEVAMEVCCNALYGSQYSSAASPDSIACHSMMTPMIHFGQKCLEDSKENLTPDESASFRLHTAKAVGRAVPGLDLDSQLVCQQPADKRQLLLGQGSGAVSCSRPAPVQHSRAACNRATPLQALQAEDTWQGALLPAPSSARSHARSSLLSQQPSRLVSHSVHESVSQPAGDVCLFGSPPRHSSKSAASAHASDRQVLQDLAARNAEIMLCENEAAKTAGPDAVSEEDFKRLLESAEQLRVQYLLQLLCNWLLRTCRF